MEVSEITTRLVSWSMDLAQSQAMVASENIANANVEGYQAKRVDFAGQLDRLQENLHSTSSLSNQLDALESQPFSFRPAATPNVLGQGVSLDTEVASAMEANARYQTLAEALNRHMGLMRMAVRPKG